MLKHYSSNLLLDMNLEAKQSTLEYIKANMVDAPYFEKHPALVRYALQQVTKMVLRSSSASVAASRCAG